MLNADTLGYWGEEMCLAMVCISSNLTTVVKSPAGDFQGPMHPGYSQETLVMVMMSWSSYQAGSWKQLECRLRHL